MVLIEYGERLPNVTLRAPRIKAERSGASSAKKPGKASAYIELGFLGAVEGGSLREMQRLLKEGRTLYDPSDGNWTPLMLAVRQRRQECVKWLLARGANPDLRSQDGRGSPL